VESFLSIVKLAVEMTKLTAVHLVKKFAEHLWKDLEQ
jgi:hypothetical protein